MPPTHPQILAHYARLGAQVTSPATQMWLRHTIGTDKRSRRIRKLLEIMAEARRRGEFVE